MKSIPRSIALLALAMGALEHAAAQPLGNAFTYQGQLKLSGQSANDLCDFIFAVFDAPVAGTQIGPTLVFDGQGGNPPPVSVVAGLFTVQLDFGVGVFQGDARFLEISVRCPSGVGAYSTLSPRQPITAAPYALYALDSPASFNLPLAVTLPSDQDLLSLTNSMGPPSGGGAFVGRASGSNPAIRGTALGDGNAGLFEGFFAGGTADVLKIFTTSDGAALKAETNGGGPAGVFINGVASNTATVLRALTNGTGRAGFFEIQNAASTSAGLQVDSNAGGDGLLANMTGTSRAGFFRINAPNPGANAATALEASTNGSGRAGLFSINVPNPAASIATALEAVTNGAGRAGFFSTIVPNPADNFNATIDAVSNGNGDVIRGTSTTGTGIITGVYGASFSNMGRGVVGVASANNGAVTGVYGTTPSNNGIGVKGEVTSAAGLTEGVVGLTNSPNGTGTRGSALAGTGVTNGVVGSNASTAGRGVFGFEFANTGNTVGVLGQVSSTTGKGVHGLATTNTGSTLGVLGEVASSAGVAVKGLATRTTGNTFGVIGECASNTATAVYGLVTSANTVGERIGVKGEFTSGEGIAVQGITPENSQPTRAIQGINGSNNNGVAIEGIMTRDSGPGTAIRAETASRNGVAIDALSTATVFGGSVPTPIGVRSTVHHPFGIAVKAVAEDGTGFNTGVHAIARGTNGTAVLAEAPAETGSTVAVDASAYSPDGVGVDAFGGSIGLKATGGTLGILCIGDMSVAGVANIGAIVTSSLQVDSDTEIFGDLTAEAVNADSVNVTFGIQAAGVNVAGTTTTSQLTTTGLANLAGNAQVGGNLSVSGTLTKGGGSFKIDHPLDPANKTLSHSFVESPDMMNIYNGNVVTDAEGFAIVRMPDWFEALNRDFRYQLTVIGTFAQAIVAEELRDGAFVIQTDKPMVKVSWQITGIRHDPWADANRIPVEEWKPMAERGVLMHPEAVHAHRASGVQVQGE